MLDKKGSVHVKKPALNNEILQNKNQNFTDIHKNMERLPEKISYYEETDEELPKKLTFATGNHDLTLSPIQQSFKPKNEDTFAYELEDDDSKEESELIKGLVNKYDSNDDADDDYESLKNDFNFGSNLVKDFLANKSQTPTSQQNPYDYCLNQNTEISAKNKYNKIPEQVKPGSHKEIAKNHEIFGMGSQNNGNLNRYIILEYPFEFLLKKLFNFRNINFYEKTIIEINK